jgi:hypothetical protein
MYHRRGSLARPLYPSDAETYDAPAAVESAFNRLSSRSGQ